MRQFFFTCKMEISENNLSFTHQRILRLNGFLYLYYHISLRIDIFYGRQYLSTNSLICIIRETTTLASSMLNKDSVSMLNQLGNTRRRHTHTVLIVLNLFGNSYFHHNYYILSETITAAKINIIFEKCKKNDKKRSPLIVI